MISPADLIVLLSVVLTGHWQGLNLWRMKGNIPLVSYRYYYRHYIHIFIEYTGVEHFVVVVVASKGSV